MLFVWREQLSNRAHTDFALWNTMWKNPFSRCCSLWEPCNFGHWISKAPKRSKFAWISASVAKRGTPPIKTFCESNGICWIPLFVDCSVEKSPIQWRIFSVESSCVDGINGKIDCWFWNDEFCWTQGGEICDAGVTDNTHGGRAFSSLKFVWWLLLNGNGS